MKICTKCSVKKDATCFFLKASSPDGIAPWCKDCVKKSKKIYRENNKEKIAAYSRQWAKKNPEKINAIREKYKSKAIDSSSGKLTLFGQRQRAVKTSNKRTRMRKIRNEAGPEYAAQIIGLPLSKIPNEIISMKSEQLLTFRLARKIRRSLDESSKNT
ncbi:MAG: hypothetical protein A0129_03645 [Limnobacter sp. CACIAM 66H1]|jgi:hypothetical protein|uniref:hypothetical protein n=1 Tax=Limnobacter sp. CACIAM 66H1 TaxID=1813033 RepID=UPI0007A8C0D3|nr:hypothetical protein [Limnobacter sp. CACIAM 66H1]KYP12233.1 MAG: hypothetical protein A0129_03645 [Limnobacter sp. CACIAM 66H1]